MVRERQYETINRIAEPPPRLLRTVEAPLLFPPSLFTSCSEEGAGQRVAIQSECPGEITVTESQAVNEGGLATT